MDDLAILHFTGNRPCELQCAGTFYYRYMGVQYSLILCSYYVPVSLLLSLKIDEFALVSAGRSQGTPSDEWKKQNNLVVHQLSSYQTIAALVSPFLTGVIGNF